MEIIHPEQVYFEGRKVFEKDKMPVERINRVYPNWIKDTIKFKRPITHDLFKLRVSSEKDFVTVILLNLLKIKL